MTGSMLFMNDSVTKFFQALCFTSVVGIVWVAIFPHFLLNVPNAFPSYRTISFREAAEGQDILFESFANQLKIY